MSPWLMAFIAAVLALAWWWRPRGAGPAAIMLLATFGVLGGVALAAQEDLFSPAAYPGFVHWKPTLFYWTLAVVFGLASFLNWGYPAKWVIGAQLPLANRQWYWFNRVLALFYALLGTINLIAAYAGAEADWQGFKEACYLNLVALILVRINFVLLPVLKDVAVLGYRFVKRRKP
ncbi:MAG: septation protein IspZ [Betaproteobacteria bacterium]|nr:septation protein IspZ [Betaproteobacteria bacterium]MDE1982699.1 septation protein IspZ [Betaproteobacteria bacterium]MDE2132878.1 septation protein IspZ [Betaproteobacteria bacterium]MDE2212739.1 septation protein IspZ [Betaproteobacteria bacterium]